MRQDARGCDGLPRAGQTKNPTTQSGTENSSSHRLGVLHPFRFYGASTCNLKSACPCITLHNGTMEAFCACMKKARRVPGVARCL